MRDYVWEAVCVQSLLCSHSPHRWMCADIMFLVARNWINKRVSQSVVWSIHLNMFTVTIKQHTDTIGEKLACAVAKVMPWDCAHAFWCNRARFKQIFCNGPYLALTYIYGNVFCSQTFLSYILIRFNLHYKAKCHQTLDFTVLSNT